MHSRRDPAWRGSVSWRSDSSKISGRGGFPLEKPDALVSPVLLNSVVFLFLSEGLICSFLSN